MKLVTSVRVLRAISIMVGTGEAVCGCDSKTAHSSSLFSCSDSPVGHGVGDELAVKADGGELKMMLFRVGGLV